jgi:CHAD domain-containing protein/uncharacterized protein YjbK
VSNIEREVKLVADRQFSIPDLRDLVKQTVRLPEQRLLATYFDTADFRLWARKITLRHRIGEGEGVGTWTLKLPHSHPGRTLDRTELEWEGPLDFVPGQVSEILRGVVRRATLQKVTTLETIRRRLVLQGGKQISLAELDDDMVTINGGPHDGDRFRQIEVELNEADDELLDKFIDRLRRAGAWLDERGPKLARALDIDVVEPVVLSLGPKSTMADVVGASIQAGFGRILDNEYFLRAAEDDPPPEAIHQTRVATRRLRSDLQTFKSLLDPLWVRHTRSDLKWLGDVLGLVRDVDVLGPHLDLSSSPATGDTNGVADLRLQLRHQRSAGAEKVADALQSERYFLLLDKLHAATERPAFRFTGSNRHQRIPPSWRASKALPKLVERPWKKLRKEGRRAGHQPSDAQLHGIRIRAKRLRYAAEAAEPVVGKPARRVAAAAEALQTQLGEHHDAVIAEEWLRRQARGASSKVAFSAGLLAAEQIRRQQEFRADWRRGLKTVDRPARGWLG